MLNKNQSKKRNYLKYYAIIPALVAFVFLFQIKTIAQEKERKEKNDLEVNKKTDPIYVFKIHKNTTDQELKEMAEKLKKNHDIDVVISDVKRNNKKELTAIKVDIQKGTGEAQSMQVEGDEAIKTCGIVITLESNGSKKIGLTTDGAIDKPMVVGNRVVEISGKNVTDINTGDLTPPTPPIPPVFPTGPMPEAPNVDTSKMPQPPVAPADHKDKIAMAKFEKELAEFEKKMESWEPDMSAFEKQVDEIMSQREAIYEKEMAKYEIAMEKFNIDMDKFTQNVEQKYGKDSKLYEVNMRQYDKDMRQYEIEMKQHQKEMKQHEKELKRMEKESRKS